MGRVLPLSALVGVSLFTAPAQARTPRPRFDPSDLALQPPGGVEIDAQFGAVHGDGSASNRLVLPDWEIDVGLADRVELDIDSAFSLDQFDSRGASWSSDALWTAVSLGLYDDHDPSGRSSVAFGLQLGPRFPVLQQRGVGYGALALFGGVFGPAHLTFNAGAVLDPLDRTSGHHPASLVTGVDYDIDLDRVDRWSVTGDAAFQYFLSDDPRTLIVTGGPSFKPSSVVEIQLAGLWGALRGDDRYGVLAQLTLTFAPADDSNP